MRFTGTIDAKLDAKGRVFLPSDFRKQLAESDPRLVLKRDVYQPCLVIYPYAVWNAEVDALRAKLNRWDPRQAMLFRQFLANVEVFTLDGNGRFLISRKCLTLVPSPTARCALWALTTALRCGAWHRAPNC